MRNQQSGFTMIEVLVTIGILVVGLLGLAALQTLTTVSELEAYQRSQAIVLVRDMADRMNGNKMNLGSYVTSPDVGTAAASCAALTGAALDLCEWGNELNGASEKAGSTNVGAMIGARGCVVKIDATNYLITVAWQGMSKAGKPKEACGDGAYGDDFQRRTVSTVVTLALLAAP